MNHSLRRLVLVVVTLFLLFADTNYAADEAAEKIAAAVQTIQNWNDGDPAADLGYLSAEVVSAAQDPDKRESMERLMIQGLAGAKTRAGKGFFCRQLVIVGTEAAVPELAKLLPDPDASHMARYALARIPGPAADAALLETLRKVDDNLKIGMVHSLGRRGFKDAVDPIASLLDSNNQDLVVASLVALSRIDSDAAVAAIAKAREGLPAQLRPAATDAYLSCAARLVSQGKASEALPIYRALFAAKEPSMCRVAALTGMVAAEEDKSVQIVIAALSDQDAEVCTSAVPLLRDVPGQQATRAILGALPKQAEDVRAMLLGVLADRGDHSALAPVVESAASSSPVVRLAALEALASLGDATVVPLLAQRAAQAQESAEQATARSGLTRLRGTDINAEIAKLLHNDKPEVRVEAARSLASRGATDQTDALLHAAADSQTPVASEALKALRTLAGAEHLPALVKLLIRAKDGGVRGQAEHAIVAAAGKVAQDEDPAAEVLAGLGETGESAVKASLIRVLGRIAHLSALPALYDAVKQADDQVKDAAIDALANWPTGEPLDVLRGIAADPSASESRRIIALQGFVNLIPKRPGATDGQILDDYAASLELASRNDEKFLVLSKLGKVRDRRALKMAKQLTEDPALKETADVAIQSIETLLAAPAELTASKNADKAGNAVDKDPATRWDSGSAMAGGEWFRIDLGDERLFTGLVLDTRGSSGDYPRGYEVYVSASSLGEGQLVAKGEGKGPVTKITFDKPARGKAIKIVQTGQSQGLYWSIHELTIESQTVEEE